MKNTKLLFVLTAIATSVVTYADNPAPALIRDGSQVEDRSPKLSQQNLDEDLLRKQKLSEQSVSAKNAKQNNVIRYTGRELLDRPDILEKLFLDALVNPNKAVLPTYIKLYQQVPNRDQSLIDWATAILEREENLNKSITSYRKLISSFPNNNFIRYQLAETLFYNQQYEAAKDQFQRLRATSVLPQDIAVFDRFLDVINKKDDWNFSFGMSFLNDKNLANAADEGTKMELPNGNTVTYNSRRQKGQGVSLWLGADKRWGMDGGKYLALESNVSNHYYWNNKRYNDFNAHLGLGVGYSDARFDIQLTPYIDKRWYGGGLNGSDALKEYSNRYGVSISSSYWLNQSFKYSNYYNYGYEKYDRVVDKKSYNGAIHALTNSIMYLPSSSQYWSLSLDLSKKYAADKTNSFDRIGARLSWGQEWPLGISTNTSFGIAKRNYKEASFLGKQKNNEYNASISIWNKKIHYAGFTPRLTWIYTKTNSNISLYTYDKNQMVIEATRTF